MPRRAHARDGPRPQGARWPRASGRSRGRARRCSSPRTTPSSRPPAAQRDAARRRPPRGRRPTTEVLGGGWYFATETARVLGGGGALLARGRRRAACARRLEVAAMSWIARLVAACSASRWRGFAWYERTHPSARCSRWWRRSRRWRRWGGSPLRRCPTSSHDRHRADLRLRARRRPGFMVGALAALASNVFFGQGPWTPWQMVGWGGVGVAGALLAHLARRALGRVPLAGRLRARGLGFGAVMDLHLWVTYSGDHTLGQAGRVLRDLAALRRRPRDRQRRVLPRLRPAFVRALERFRPRFEVRWLPAARGAARSRPCSGVAAPRRAAAGDGGRRRGRQRLGRATWRTPRTTTAAGAARPASARRSSTRAGRRSGSPPRAATRSTPARRARSPTSAPARAS